MTFTLPHPFDRSNQTKAYQVLLDSNKKYIVLKLPTGSGKSAIAAKMAEDAYKTLSLVQAKSLQSQYSDGYDFYSITGKGDYDCYGYGMQLDFLNDNKLTADLCQTPKECKDQCKSNCPYPIAREEFVNSIAGTTNYTKFLLDKPLITGTDFTPGFKPDYLFLDEAHLLSDTVLSFAGIRFSWKSERLIRFCKPIHLDPESVDLPLPLARSKVRNDAEMWLSELYSTMNQNMPVHPVRGGDVKIYYWHKRLVEKIDIVLEAMKTEVNCWFIYADENGMTIKPLTGRFHFKSMFNKAEKIVLMSATIQPKDVMSLGLAWDEVEYIDLPNPILPQHRPIELLDTPNITWQSLSDNRVKHAQIISDRINQTPDSWTTMIHFPSKQKTESWAEVIEQRTRRPVFVPEQQIGTDRAYSNWLEFNHNNNGAICCAWQFWTGIDAGYINTIITMDCPYPNFGDKYEKARFDYSPSEARVRVANTIEQSQGRNRRGHSNHYGPLAEKLNIICNSSKFQRLKSAFDKDFWRSIL